MSHYIDEHGSEVDYNPRLRGGPGSVGEALYRTHMLHGALAIAKLLGIIADRLESTANKQEDETDVDR